MSYQEYADTFEAIGEPVRAIGALYERTRTEIEAAITLGRDGSATVDRDALRKALDIAPPAAADRLDRVIGRLDLGFAMAGRNPVAPWSAFLDAQAVKPLDAGTWKSFGFGPGARGAEPFSAFKNVPAEVVTPENLAMLRAVAAGSKTLRNIVAAPPSSQALVTPFTAIYTLEPAHLAAVTYPPASDTSSSVGTSQQALSPSDLTSGIDCLIKGKWSFTGWGFVLTCCIDRACADTIEAMLGLGTGTLLAGALALLTKGLVAAVSAVGGWVALAILLSALYWAAMIHFNKTPRGVCINIPMPWSFGVIGPGWAQGL